jgi:tRNA(Ile)-lysidine synthase
MARANAALDLMADGAERYLARLDAHGGREGFDLAAFSTLTDEIRVRLLLRMIDRIGHEGPAELGKVEALLQALDSAAGSNKPDGKRALFKQSLAGAVISIE